MEGESSINKIVGIPDDLPEVKKGSANYLTRKFDHPEVWEDEKKLSAEQQDVVDSALNLLEKECEAQYGVKGIGMSDRHVHLVDVSNLDKERQSKLRSESYQVNGNFNLKQQRIHLFEHGRPLDNLEMVEYVVHEGLHMLSFTSLTAATEDGMLASSAQRRCGFQMVRHEKKEKLTKQAVQEIQKEGATLYTHLNEGMTQELTVRFIRENISKLPHMEKALDKNKKFLAAEYKKMKKENPQMPILLEDEVTGVTYGDPKGKKLIYYSTTYWEERKELIWDMKDIFKKNKDRFIDEEHVFQFFVKHYFDGRLLEIARLIEHTYGKGAFRRGVEFNMDKSS